MFDLQLQPKDLHRPTRSPRLLHILLCTAQTSVRRINSATADAELARPIACGDNVSSLAKKSSNGRPFVTSLVPASEPVQG